METACAIYWSKAIPIHSLVGQEMMDACFVKLAPHHFRRSDSADFIIVCHQRRGRVQTYPSPTLASTFQIIERGLATFAVAGRSMSGSAMPLATPNTVAPTPETFHLRDYSTVGERPLCQPRRTLSLARITFSVTLLAGADITPAVQVLDAVERLGTPRGDRGARRSGRPSRLVHVASHRRRHLARQRRLIPPSRPAR